MDGSNATIYQVTQADPTAVTLEKVELNDGTILRAAAVIALIALIALTILVQAVHRSGTIRSDQD